jgi:PTH1 family peptidyl-tRNA hydrolase
MAWLVAGLGNPGDRYSASRHNVGRMTVESLAAATDGRFRKARFLPAEVADIHLSGERVLLVRSLRFMNESGPSYAGVAKKNQIDPDHLIAVYDELDLPAGAVRVRLGGGGSHNGLRSLQRSLRSPEFFRVRVGVGRPPGQKDPTDFLLEQTGKAVASELREWADRAAEAIRVLIEDGLANTQERFNRAPPPL